MTTNRFRETCARCGKPVEPGEGLVSGKDGSKWHVVHNNCIPVYVPRRERAKEPK